MRNKILTIAVLMSVSAMPAAPGWFSDFTGVNIDPFAGKFEIGTPQPGPAIERLPQVINNLPQDIANLANPAGLALAAAIRHAKSQAAWGARQIPPQIQQQLAGHFPADILQGVRYNTFDNARITLDSATMLLNNDVAAVTLDDIVVFRNGQDAQNNAELWAHELTHVLQYRSRGIDTFANTYSTNAWVLENEAKNNANRIASMPVQAPASYAYFMVTGQLLFGDANGNLSPADPQTGRVVGPPNGRVVMQNGQWVAIDSFGRAYPAVRVR